MLIESHEKEFIEYLNDRLFARGINSAVFTLGGNAQGEMMYGIDVALVEQQSLAFHLLFQDQAFLADLGNTEYANRVFALRTENLNKTGNLLSSKLMRHLSLIALAILAIYFLIELFR